MGNPTCSYCEESEGAKGEQFFASPLENLPFSPGGLMPNVLSILGLGRAPRLRLRYHGKEFKVLSQVLWRGSVVPPGCW